MTAAAVLARLLPLALATLLASGCGSSDDDAGSDPSADDPVGTTGSAGDGGGTAGDGSGTDGADGGVTGGEGTAGDGGATDDGDGSGTDAGTTAGDGPGTDTGTTTGDGSGTDTGTTGGDGGETDGGDPEVLIPAFPGDSNAGRVLQGLRRTLGTAVLGLNGRLARGEELDEAEEDCLGAYEPGLGEPLLGIDCSGTLALAAAPDLVLSRGAFYATEACEASVSAGALDGCVLRAVEMAIRTRFVQPEGALRPQPEAGSGAEISYDVERPSLLVESDADALTGAFRCELDVLTGGSLPGTSGDCDTRLREVADQLDRLLPRRAGALPLD